MEKNISKEKLDKIAEKYNVFYFPIRHHSPVCSYHITKFINDYKPDCILVEGPSNCNDLLNCFLDKNAKYPLAIYYSYKEPKKSKTDEDFIYNCYYPMLEYSPELVCIQVGANLNIPVEFIDLSYANRLLNTTDDVGLRKKSNKMSLSDDYLVSQSDFIYEIYTRYNCMNFDEFWDKIFEINGLNMSTLDFIDMFNSYTYYLRKMSKKNDLDEDSTIIREDFMANKILKAKEKYNKILVVTGGFHTYGLIQNSTKKPEEFDYINNLPEQLEGEDVYVMPYSMEECDALNGYLSGMISPNFYQTVWENMQVNSSNAYQKTVFDYILNVANLSIKKNYQISLPDEKNAYDMAVNLAYLRDKTQPSKYECQDGILSAFIKGEYSPATDLPMDILKGLLTGNKIGSITANFKTPPIAIDFTEKCKLHKIKIDDAFDKNINLSVFSNPKHRDASRFLTQVEFLDCGFANKKSGGRFKKDINKKLIKEAWQYKYTSSVISKLIENSIYGGTIFEACYNMLLKKIDLSENSQETSTLLIDAFLMGIDDKNDLLFDKIYTSIMSDNDFFSSANTLKNLTEIHYLNQFYEENSHIDYIKLIDICFDRAINSLIYVINVNENLQNDVISLLKLLYQLTLEENFKHHYDILVETLQNLVIIIDINSMIEGAIYGILYATKNSNTDIITAHFDNYLHSSDDITRGARFLLGLFSTAREIIFVDTKFIERINKLISLTDYQDFMLLLPDLRLSFSNFTPTQINKISKIVADYNNISVTDFVDKLIIPENERLYGQLLNDYLIKELQIYGGVTFE